ncbi:DUF1257 domain-containing protein [Paenibacillus sp. Leaf72]|uniref:DUF1257 domain-containing protein n=1 Tax=Paenibacillus sp. Leaf72 TaxID=1736234 RepID=UPI0006FC2BF1|nr:DUF1257 domain-containing protein [Paenibacillus sp. Leaf72]KQN96863.1 hypothetical protein ASF12_22605 [Paenibacillus sp. Leaf72]
MSHYSTVKTEIRNIRALEVAVKQLELILIENGICRGYTEQQNMKADYVIQLKGPYDVALNKQSNGTYDLQTDWWAGHVEREIGKNAGRLMQEYNIGVVTMEARRQGQTVIRREASDGTIKLRVQVRR